MTPVEQIEYVLKVPAPFIVALLVAVVPVISVLWVLFLWAYKARIEKWKELYEASLKVAQAASRVSAEREAELTSTVVKQAEQIKVLEAQKDEMSAELRQVISELVTSSNTALRQIGQLRIANSQTSEAVRRISARVSVLK